MKHGLIIAGTGHRPNKLGGYSEDIYTELIKLASMCIEKYKPSQIISGMALGWDQALSEAAIQYNIPLTAAIPFINQESKWPKLSQEKYKNILSRSTKIITSEGGYSACKMQLRNQWMVENCDAILALWDGSSSGTANCIEYANKLNRKVINIWPVWELMRSKIV